MAQYDVNLREYWRIIRKRKSIVLAIAVILGIFSTAFAILSAPAPLYSTECMIEIKRDRLVEGIYSKTVAWDDADDIETQIAVIKSYTVFEKVAEAMGLAPRRSSSKAEDHLKSSVIATIEGLQSKVEVTRLKYSSVLTIKATDDSADFAQRLANTVALVYKELHGEQQTKRTKEALRYIDDQMKEVRERLRDAEDRFNRFNKDNELISIDLQSETLLKQTKEIQGEIAKLEEEKAELESLLARLSEFIKNPVGAGHNFDSMRANTRYQVANDALIGLLLKRETLLKEFTPKHPEVVAISNEISETARKMEFMLELQLKGQERRQAESSKELEKIDQKTRALLDKKLEHGRLKREVELYTEMTTLLERKNQEALIRRSEKPEEVNIVKPALLPAIPINPPRTAATGAMGVIIGIVLGLIIAFIVETFDTSLGAIEDVEQTLRIPVLGVIPHVDLRAMQQSISERYSGRVEEHALKQAVNLISHFAPNSMMAESFRALRTNIHFKDTEKKIRSLAITSTSPQEGKTLVALNLAITMAQSGLKTLLVGTDLRKPMLARVFGVSSSPGLSDILLENYEWRETVSGVTDILMGEITIDEIMITPGFDNFFFIPGGVVPPNPTDLIESQRIDQFIAEAKKEYDMILFDTAPLLSAVDPAILATKVDGVLLLYRIGAVPKGLLKRAINQLSQVKANVVGVILNGMRPEVSPDFEDYKQYRSYYSSGEDGKRKRKKKSLPNVDRRERDLPAFELSPLSPLPEAVGEVTKGRDRWKRNLGLSLLALAAVLLVPGLLWNTGLLSFFKPVSAGNVDGKPGLEKPIREEGAKESHLVREPVPTAPAPVVAAAPDSKSADREIGEAAPLLSETTPEPLAEEKEIAAPAPAEEEVSPSARYPFSLYLCTMPNAQEAQWRVFTYRKNGVNAYYSEVELRSGVRYRVYAGYFESEEQAERFREEKGLKDAEVKETPFANLIGTFSPQEDLKGRIRALKKLGFSAYAVRDPDENQRLLVGAFHGEDRAQRQYERLKSKGIENQIVKR